MSLVVTVTITLKNEEKTYKEKFLVYDPLTLSLEDESLKLLIAKAKLSFKATPDSIMVKTSALYE
jgi:hypothetical protein